MCVSAGEECGAATMALAALPGEEARGSNEKRGGAAARAAPKDRPP